MAIPPELFAALVKLDQVKQDRTAEACDHADAAAQVVKVWREITRVPGPPGPALMLEQAARAWYEEDQLPASKLQIAAVRYTLALLHDRGVPRNTMVNAIALLEVIAAEISG